jgi:hypothetical protein
MCDNRNALHRRGSSAGAVIARRDGRPGPVWGHAAGTRAAAELVLRAEFRDSGTLAEFEFGGPADGNADRRASAPKRSRVRA